MPMQIFCPRCQTGYTLADKQRGQVIECKNCKRKIQVGDDGDNEPTTKMGVQAQRSVPCVAAVSKPRPVEVEDDDLPRRRRDDYEDDDRPQRTGRRSEPKSNVGLVIVLCFLTGGLLAAGVIGSWYWLNRAPAPVAQAPVFPPPFDPGRNIPFNNVPNNIVPPQNNFGNIPAQPGEKVDPNLHIVLSNPRCEKGGIIPVPTIIVDYHFQNAPEQFGGEYSLLIKPKKGNMATAVPLWNPHMRQSGTVQAAILGPLMGEPGPLELFVDYGQPGPFGNRVVVSNTVTLAADKLNGIAWVPPGGLPGMAPLLPGMPPGPPGLVPGLPANGPALPGIGPDSLPKTRPGKKREPLDDAGITKALADLKTNTGGKVQALLRDLAATPQVAARQAEVANSLLEFVTNQDHAVAIAAVMALKTWATKEQVPGLLKGLDHSWSPVRKEVLKTLTPFKDPRAIEPIVRLLGELSEQDLAAEALSAIGPAAEKAVWKMLTHPNAFTRSRVCNVLGDIGGLESIGLLTDFMGKEQDVFVVDDARWALERIKGRMQAPKK